MISPRPRLKRIMRAAARLTGRPVPSASPSRGSRRPLLLACCIAIFCAYVTHTLYMWVDESIKVFNQYEKMRIDNVIDYYQLAEIMLRNNETDAYKARLEYAVKQRQIDVYRVEKNGKVLFEHDPVRLIEYMKFPEDNRLLFRNGLSYTRYVDGESTVILGVQNKIGIYTYELIKENLGLIARDIAIVMLLVTLLLSYFTRDIAQLLVILKSARRNFKGIKIRSAEGEVLLKGLTTLDLSLDELENQNRQLRNQVLPALNSELLSGRTPPYEFECTLVRVDVNNFSHIFTNYAVEDFMSVINRFFERVTEIVSRYRGYVYEFVGDEVIFYFKDDEHVNSAAIALSVLRDINEVANEIDVISTREHGYGFRVKSSAAHGKLRFGPQVNGFSLAGAILIETVRILTHIDEKEDNVIYYTDDIKGRVAFLVESRAQKIALLKGMRSERQLNSYVSHPDLGEVLETINPENTEILGFYRSDAHLIKILDFLGDPEDKLESELFLAVARRLRAFKIPKASKALQDAYMHLLETLIKRCDSPNIVDDDLFKLSSTLTIALHLLDNESFEKTFKPFFKNCLQFQDRRVVANSIDVIAYFSSFDEDGLFRKLLKHSDNRIVANALVKEGMKEISRTVVRRTSKMLGSQDPKWVASGLYVIGELARHHRAQNLVYYETHSGFQVLTSRIRRFIGHENAMIRSQALIAARKTASGTTREAIDAFYNSSADSKIREEVERLYLQPTSVEALHPQRRMARRSA